MRGTLWVSLLVGAALAVLLATLVAAQAFVLGSPSGRWIYEYIEGFNLRALLTLAAATALCSMLAALPLSLARSRPLLMVVAWLMVGTAAQGLVRAAAPYSLGLKFKSDGSNSFYSPTLTTSAAATLADFGHVRQTLPVHARANMPGKLMLVYALETLSTDPATLAYLVVALSNLGGLLLY